jgi:TonB family protein
MASASIISNDNTRPGERRASPRQALRRCVVLAFFGEDNWGKLTNVSERGMAFEFSRPPSLGNRINFTFQVMGCMPIPPDAGVLNDSFAAAGEVVWMRDFERGAGVQFVDLAERSREQIRQWLSLEASAKASIEKEKTKLELPLVLTEAAPPTAPVEEILDMAEPEPPQTETELESLPQPELESPPQPEEEIASLPTATEMLAPLELVGHSEAVEWQPRPSPRAHSSVARLTFLVVSGCLAAFTVTAGVRIYMARAARRAETLEPSNAGAARGESRRTVEASSGISSAVSFNGSASDASRPTASPFQVEVLDANGRRWMLWFVRHGSANGDGTSASTARLPKRKDTTPEEEPLPPRTFTLVVPSVNRPAQSDAGSLSAEAPPMQAESTPAPRDPMGSLSGSRPAPPPEPKPIGGMVQPARLIHSTPPVYPALAKSLRVSGDVVVDALIDATGKVTATKVVSGPDLLQNAAIQTVRQWKYEAARLDGQAVAMHLNVTVKFHLNDSP